MYKPELEAVEVVVYFCKLKVNIIKFKRGRDVYKVSEQISTWNEIVGDTTISHYTVVCKNQNLICELSYNRKDDKWLLVHWDERY